MQAAQEMEITQFYVLSKTKNESGKRAVFIANCGADQIDDIIVELNNTGFEEDKISAEDAARIYNAIDKLSVTANTFVHEDFHSNNIIVQGDDLLLIDVDDSCVGNPAVDLAGMFTAFDSSSSSDEASLWVLGMNAEESKRYWNKFKEVYFEGMDEKEIGALTFKMKFFGTIKLLYGINKTDMELGADKNVLIQQIVGGIRQMMDAVNM